MLKQLQSDHPHVVCYLLLQALLSADVIRRLMRNSQSLLLQICDHQKVHKKIVEFAAEAVQGAGAKKLDVSDIATAGSSGIAPAVGKSPGKQGRRFVVPRVPLSKGLPAW